nr:MAG TPA: hypothetical protein [Caudoviricetes sp.]
MLKLKSHYIKQVVLMQSIVLSLVLLQQLPYVVCLTL